MEPQTAILTSAAVVPILFKAFRWRELIRKIRRS
jgi:hypothetical protein